MSDLLEGRRRNQRQQKKDWQSQPWLLQQLLQSQGGSSNGNGDSDNDNIEKPSDEFDVQGDPIEITAADVVSHINIVPKPFLQKRDEDDEGSDAEESP